MVIATLKEVRCQGILRNGKRCNERLFDVDQELWEQGILQGKIVIKCDGCKKLEDFRDWT